MAVAPRSASPATGAAMRRSGPTHDGTAFSGMLFGPRSLGAQRTDGEIAVSALTSMAELGMPRAVEVAWAALGEPRLNTTVRALESCKAKAKGCACAGVSRAVRLVPRSQPRGRSNTLQQEPAASYRGRSGP